MKAIKVVRREGEKLVSAFISEGWILGPRERQAVRDAMVEYIPGEWVTPRAGAGPLCAWKPSAEPRISLDLSMELWEVKVRPWGTKLPRVHAARSDNVKIMAIWLPETDHSRFFFR